MKGVVVMKSNNKVFGVVVICAAMLAPSLAFAGTTGQEFQVLFNLLLGWTQGFLGKTIAVAAFLIGMGMGIAKSSPIPALAGVVFAMFVAYIPTVINGIVTGVI